MGDARPMDKKDVEASVRKATKGIKTEEELINFRQMLINFGTAIHRKRFLL